MNSHPCLRESKAIQLPSSWIQRALKAEMPPQRPKISELNSFLSKRGTIATLKTNKNKSKCMLIKSTMRLSTPGSMMKNCFRSCRGSKNQTRELRASLLFKKKFHRMFNPNPIQKIAIIMVILSSCRNKISNIQQ